MRRIRLVWAAAACALVSGGLALQGCVGDDTTVEPKRDSGTDATVTPQNPQPPPPSGDGGPGTDGGGPGATTSYTVPAGGGTVTVQGASQPIALTFPASAAGVNVTITVSDPAAIGWGTGQFSDVLRLGPAGTRFADPVVVKPASKASLLFTFPDGTSKQTAEPVPFSASAAGYLLKHFSTLVLAPPGKYCDSEGYDDSPDSGRCDTDAGATTFRSLTCKSYTFCLVINGSCCVVPGTDAGGCTTENQKYAFSYTPTESTNGGQYPYCVVDAGDWDGGDAGCSGGAFGYQYGVDGGCSLSRQCAPSYAMSCNGTGCTCAVGGNDSGAFTQGTTCDTAATMKTAYVQRCNFPSN
jgi:hypothetical protein